MSVLCGGCVLCYHFENQQTVFWPVGLQTFAYDYTLGLHVFYQKLSENSIFYEAFMKQAVKHQARNCKTYHFYLYLAPSGLQG